MHAATTVLLRIALALAVALLLLLSSAPARAQTNPNPPVTACGLPAGTKGAAGSTEVTASTIWSDEIYTLNADCELIGPLYLNFMVNLTINGAGHRITLASNFEAFSGNKGFVAANNSNSLTLNRVTLDAGGKDLGSWLDTSNTLTATDVTFQNHDQSQPIGFCQTGHTWNLTNVLFRDNRGGTGGDPSLFLARGTCSLTMNNVAFENNVFGTGAIKIEDSPTISLTGCLSDAANWPALLRSGSLDTSSSTGACAGTVGNSHSLRNLAARAGTCGMPGGGEASADATWTLNQDCLLNRDLIIKQNVTVTINGNGHRIRGAVSIFIGRGARLNINNAALHTIRIYNAGHLEGELLAFYNQSARAIWNQGTANINKLLLKNLNLAPRRSQAILSYGIVGNATLTIRDSHFENVTNRDSRATLWALAAEGSASITLEGCLTVINNIPEALSLETSGGTVTDSSVGECDADFIYEFPRQSRPVPREHDEYRPPTTRTISTCSTLDGIVSYNITESTQCQRVNAMQIANPAIKDGDFADAVDVWGWVRPNSEICFEASGSAIKFIDTAAMPRATTDLIAYSRQDTVCASIDGPGILILLPGQPPYAGQSTPIASQSLSGCMVWLTEKLNFRETPGGRIMGGLSKDFQLTAEARTADWFKVDFWGKKGWISADYVTTTGACG